MYLHKQKGGAVGFKVLQKPPKGKPLVMQYLLQSLNCEHVPITASHTFPPALPLSEIPQIIIKTNPKTELKLYTHVSIYLKHERMGEVDLTYVDEEDQA